MMPELMGWLVAALIFRDLADECQRLATPPIDPAIRVIAQLIYSKGKL